jgi:hypothetical protein
MSYVPGYEFDLFVSFSPVDDAPSPKPRHGRVSSLVDDLTSRLRKHLPGSAFTYWLDEQHLGGDMLPGAVADQVKRSALFLVVQSPAYLRSEFCRRELEAFVSAAGERSRRLFVIDAMPLPDGERPPPALENAHRHRFWDGDRDKPRPLGWPDNAELRAYHERLDELCWGMAAVLQELKEQRLSRLSERAPAASDPPITVPPKAPDASAQAHRRVFISYRREDAKYQAQRIFEAFTRKLPRDHVFMDIDSIPPGADFVETLEGWVEQCEILLALIGPGWLGVRDPNGDERRLDNEDDFVRIEIRKALARGIPVVPVLLDGAPMPKGSELPDDIRKLVRRQAQHVEFRTFDDDVARLIGKLGL